MTIGRFGLTKECEKCGEWTEPMAGPGERLMLCKLKACWKCAGDLVLDGDEWRCWQCGHYYYPKPLFSDLSPDVADAERHRTVAGRMIAVHGRAGRRAARDINSVIAAKDRSDHRWWARNQSIIRFLDEGRTVREISALIGRGQRQIRVIRERLNDLRTDDLDSRSIA